MCPSTARVSCQVFCLVHALLNEMRSFKNCYSGILSYFCIHYMNFKKIVVSLYIDVFFKKFLFSVNVSKHHIQVVISECHRGSLRQP